VHGRDLNQMLYLLGKETVLKRIEDAKSFVNSITEKR
jgi:hypothetical protein